MKRSIIFIFLTCLCSLLFAQEQPNTRKQTEVIDETPTSVTVRVTEYTPMTYEEALAQLMEGRIVNWHKKVQTKDFTAANFSQMDSVKKTIPVFSPTDASNIFREKHGVYEFIMGNNGIEKIIVNMVGLFPSDDDPKQRYVLFRLNKYLDITAREEALRFPRQGGEIEIEFINDNAGLSLYLEGDYTNLGKDFWFSTEDGYSGISSYNDRSALNKYSVKYKIVIPPANSYTDREVFACHWSCSWMDCYYGSFNLVVVQEGSTPDKRPVYVW